MTKHVVIAEYVTLRVRDQVTGATVVNEFYRGATVPENADQENLDRLVGKGMVAAEGTEEAELLGSPAGTPLPGEPPNVPVQQEMLSTPSPEDRLQRVREAAASDRRGAERTDGRPAVNAPKAEWVDYAVTQRPEGTLEEDARAEAESMTKADLVARHGGAQG